MTRVGIDLGTTNTVAAVDGRVVHVPSEGGSILPSVVAFPPTGTTLIGRLARRRRAIDTKNTIYSAKRLIGRAWRAREVKEFQEHYPFDLVQAPDGGPAFRTRAGDFTPTAIGRIVLSEICSHFSTAERHSAVALAVPSKFLPAHREATLEAAHQAGLTNVRVIDEPVATALAYLSVTDEKLRYAAAYDLGGGTFDVAILDCSQRPLRVLASDSDLYLGGDDIDRALANWAADEVLRTQRWDLRNDREVFDRLIVECEQAKIRLSHRREARIALAQVDPGGPIASTFIVIDEAKLANISSELMHRTFGICDEVLHRSGLKARDIDAVFPAGGTTQLPMVRDGLAKYFGKEPRSDLDPMQVVSIGASVAA